MSCFCKHNPCVNVVRVYEVCELIYTKEGYFEIVCSPKVCIKQRLIDIDGNKNKVRIIIKLFNYERICFENVSIINVITPIPKSICINEIDGLWCYENGNMVVNFPLVQDLSVATIDYTACFDDVDSVESSIYLKGNSNDDEDSKNFKKCKSVLKL